jgi:hypothetical protein
MTKARSKYVRAIFSLPKAVAGKVQAYATIGHGGNKSAFVADAIRCYVDHLRRVYHTTKLRQAYAASAQQARAVNQEWEHLDDETWAKLDQLNANAGKGK